MEIARKIAANVQALLDNNNVSITDISNYLEVSRQTMTNYLKASSTLDSVQLVKLADYFNVPVSELIKDNDTDASQPAMLFRSAVHYDEAVSQIETLIRNYWQEYLHLAKETGSNICFLPEQYNLSVDTGGTVVDINFECKDFFSSKLKIDDTLRNDIWQIADTQRRLLGIEGKGAIDLIPALTSRGINVLFLDMQTTDIFGLSICDEEKGCFIFVNTNSNITIERQLFTIAHEYGHCVLHRPIFRRKIPKESGKQSKTSILDAMADEFAGRLLCNPSDLALYKEQFNTTHEDIASIIQIAMPIKKRLQISLQSLMMGLKKYGFISAHTLNDFYALLRRTGSTTNEPASISSDFFLINRYEAEKRAQILHMLRILYRRGKLKNNDLSYFLGCTEDEAQKYIAVFDSELYALKNVFSE